MKVVVFLRVLRFTRPSYCAFFFRFFEDSSNESSRFSSFSSAYREQCAVALLSFLLATCLFSTALFLRCSLTYVKTEKSTR